MKCKGAIQIGSSSVFADLNLRNAADLSIQAELTRLIYLRIKRLGLTQVQAAARLGLRQPDVSKLMNGQHSGFSTERLFRFLIALDHDIEIIVRQRPRSVRHAARMSVVAA